MPDTIITRPHLSFEFFPPKSESGAEKLWECVRRLAVWQPEFVSITCGAGGSSIDGTFAAVRHIREKIGIPLTVQGLASLEAESQVGTKPTQDGCQPLSCEKKINVAPHMAMGRQRRSRLRAAVDEYKKLGVHHVVAIRGDISQTGEDIPADDLYGNTVDFVTELHADFGIEPIVAAYPDVHPMAESPQQDIDHLKRKIAAGARFAVTQFFFEASTFLRFRDKARAAGIDVPLIPGIMPIHNLAQALKFAGGCGMTVPAGFTDRFTKWGDDADALFREGVAHASGLCEILRREGVEGFHFYALNRSEMADAVCRGLRGGG